MEDEISDVEVSEGRGSEVERKEGEGWYANLFVEEAGIVDSIHWGRTCLIFNSIIKL